MPEYSTRFIERFWSRINKTESCWLWTGYATHRGYGRVRANGKLTRCHRLAWILTNGPIPDGMEVMHNCPSGDNPLCCNPAHLLLGTHADNMADASRKKQIRYGEKHGRAILSEDDVRKIRALYAQGGYIQKTIGLRFGVATRTISSIVNRKIWKHVT